MAGVSGYRREDFLPWHYPGRPRWSAKRFYDLLGVEDYACIDLHQEHGAIAHDLNYPLEDASLWGKADLVTDYGSKPSQR